MLLAAERVSVYGTRQDARSIACVPKRYDSLANQPPVPVAARPAADERYAGKHPHQL